MCLSQMAETSTSPIGRCAGREGELSLTTRVWRLVVRGPELAVALYVAGEKGAVLSSPLQSRRAWARTKHGRVPYRCNLTPPLPRYRLPLMLRRSRGRSYPRPLCLLPFVIVSVGIGSGGGTNTSSSMSASSLRTFTQSALSWDGRLRSGIAANRSGSTIGCLRAEVGMAVELALREGPPMALERGCRGSVERVLGKHGQPRGAHVPRPPHTVRHAHLRSHTILITRFYSRRRRAALPFRSCSKHNSAVGAGCVTPSSRSRADEEGERGVMGGGPAQSVGQARKNSQSGRGVVYTAAKFKWERGSGWSLASRAIESHHDNNRAGLV